ncbi:transcriptional regulator [Candidatus Roizmanbacteria bacterium RIFCSPHIGHO2_01_FULL_39_12c]|uniref:Transcriptional regulator n=1 Tax=Candidatus Roizmanbacteria bacterium RIFCSPHIGHO2_01_FULL_39_12c TaxID=1802031 RepID=A0A1F7GCX5_9BACT|nr:MAG: transcriptional regulator [Candidatus Roizmanbacteria bacterium RIFCSPHIGHO2_01_FULL_39_12c]
MRSWRQLKAELLRNKEVRKEYDKLTPRYEVISELISARIKKGITQKELAQKVGTKQSAIARFEAGNVNPSLGFLEKMAEVMGYKLNISLSK